MSSTIQRFTETKASTGWTDLPLYRTAPRARILLADDHDLLLEAFRRLLEPEFNIIGGVGDGETLVEAALALRPDAVLCDISMPQMDGHAVLRALREIPHTARIPFIFLTARGEHSDVRGGMTLGADDYLIKPFGLTDLRSRVQRWLSADAGRA